ncbi:hypothetical protein BA763_12355 [Burkholderia cenocepacia]|nr:hypothetical protein BA763_12355 [Burkholderia cenocepacia]
MAGAVPRAAAMAATTSGARTRNSAERRAAGLLEFMSKRADRAMVFGAVYPTHPARRDEAGPRCGKLAANSRQTMDIIEGDLRRIVRRG